jgi:hypothetical protein
MAVKKLKGAYSLKERKTKTFHVTKTPKSGNGDTITLKAVKDLAKSKGINPGKMKKAEIIKNIQRVEGNFDCFGSATAGYCDQQGCLWITICLHTK